MADSYRFLSDEEIKEIRSSPPWGADALGSPQGAELELGNRVVRAALSPYDPRTDEPFDIYKNMVDRHKFWYYDEPTFYEDYRKLWLFNPWAHMVLEHLLTEMFGDGFHIEGPGKTAVREFFQEDDTYQKLINAHRQAIMLGNGFLDLKTTRRKLKSTEVLDAESIRIDWDTRGKLVYEQVVDYIRRRPYKVDRAKNKLNPKNLAHFTLKTYPNSPYGVSLFRANLYFLKALDETGGDIPAAIKRSAYSPIVVGLDLDELDDAAKETTAVKYAEKMHKVQSAVTNYVIDKKHEMYMLGSKGGGGGQALKLPIFKLIDPLVAVVLINFGMPLGLFLQTGANKAILREQKQAAKRMIDNLREPITRYLEKTLFPLITPRKAEVHWNDDLDTNIRKRKMMLLEFQLKLISREYYQHHAAIEDTGTTFFEGEELKKRGDRPGEEKPKKPGGGLKKPRQEENEPELVDDTIEEAGL